MVANTPSSIIRKGIIAKAHKTAHVPSRRAEACSPRPRMSSSRCDKRDPPTVASLRDLQDLEKRIEEKINSAKRSILYNLAKIYRVLKANSVVANGTPVDEEATLQTMLDMHFPLDNDVAFNHLEEKLKDADVKTVMKKYMSLFCCGTTPAEDIANILPELIRKNIQLLYSGSGKVQKGIGKRNFSATETYSCMEEILMKKYKLKFSPKQIKTYTGTWLSRAGDREGGKMEREAKAAAQRANRTDYNVHV